jgi:gamma-glutamyltranspeptidase/glutathione hydrolase
LKAMGYKVEVRAPMGDVNAIMVDPKTGVIYGSGDPRNEF